MAADSSLWVSTDGGENFRETGPWLLDERGGA
jgi:hypothetical protein